MKKFQKHKINGEVRFPTVRLIGRTDAGVMSSRDAYNIAVSEEKDLILINETSNPPIVKIEEYTKFLYEIEKAEKEKKKNAPKNETKEIQLSVTIGENDLKTKAKRAMEFIQDGMKVKCVLMMKGRQKARPEQGEIVMLKFADMLSEVAVPESMPKMEGGKWLAILKPKKK